MTSVEVVLGDGRIWVRTATRHDDGPCAVVPCSDGSFAVVGSNRDDPGAISVLELIESAHIGVSPRALPVAEALDIVARKLFDSVGATGRQATVTVVCPTTWGVRQHSLVSSVFQRYASEVTIETVSERVAYQRRDRVASELIAVVEMDSLCTTVSAVSRLREQAYIAAVEHEPTVGQLDLDRMVDVAAMIERVLEGRRPCSLVIMSSRPDPPFADALVAALPESWTVRASFAEVVPWSLLSVAPQRSALREIASPVVEHHWVGTLREQAAMNAQQKVRPSRLQILGVAATVTAVALAAVVMAARGTTDEMSSPSTEVPSTHVPAPSVAGPSPLVPTTVRRDRFSVGRVSADLPAGWQVRAGDRGDSRAVLVPASAVPVRITVMYNTTSSTAEYGQLVGDLAARISSAEPGKFWGFARDRTVSGRPGAVYEETPGDGTTVKWQVLFDGDVQVSIGCQAGAGGWGGFATACDEVVGSIAIATP